MPLAAYHRTVLYLLLALAGVGSLLLTAEPTGHPPKPFTTGEPDTLFIPLHMHLLRSPPEGPAYGTRLTTRDAERILAKANLVWADAGIRFWCYRIGARRHEPGPAHHEPQSAGSLLRLLPRRRQPAGQLHVFFLSGLAVNGLYIQRDAILVNESARLWDAGSGIDEPLPRVLAHELGHALGLAHSYDVRRAMAPGTTGTRLSSLDIAHARENALRLPGVETSREFAAKAAAAYREGRRAEALARWRALAALETSGTLAEYARRMLKERPAGMP